MEMLHDADAPQWRCSAVEMLRGGDAPQWRCSRVEMLRGRAVIMWQLCEWVQERKGQTSRRTWELSLGDKGPPEPLTGVMEPGAAAEQSAML